MSAKIVIKNLGPITDCEMPLEHFSVLTGAQGSGKSTIAKCIYFCRTIKDDIVDIVIKYKLSNNTLMLKTLIMKSLRNKFLQMFGTSMAMSKNMMLKYFYSDNTFINISLGLPDDSEYINPKFVQITFSDNIYEYIKNIDKTPVERENVRAELNILFNGEFNSIFIPAGRSLISILTSQLNYLFATMDDDQKRSIDYCTQKYIEYILKIRPSFTFGLEGLASDKSLLYKYDKKAKKSINKIQELILDVLKGRYTFVNGE